MSVWRAAAQEMAIAVLGHPACAGEMRFPGTPRTCRLRVGIDSKDSPCDLAPIGVLRLGIQKTQIGDLVLFIIAGKHGRCGRGVNDVRFVLL